MSNETKQTAVEWLAGELSNHLEMPHKYFIEILEQAKEMEKEQMIEFGELVWKNLLRSDKIMKSRDVYNETYGGNK
jgi:hypothetical protein